jgi:hypothetical protein
MADTSEASPAEPKQANQRDSGHNAKDPAPGGSSSGSKLSGPALWVAVFALAVWVAFSVVLIFNVGKNEIEWTRIAWIFGSIQSVAFAAAGALFGTAVQQQNVSNARQEASSAKNDADQQRDMAVRGRARAAMVQAESVTPANGDPSRLEPMGPGRAGTTESGVAYACATLN